jgi:mersacidin/lichenicidin family type 2 lantibiotic
MTENVDPRTRKLIARAWKDEEFRNGLPAETREKLPPAPDGASHMSDEQLETAAGGTAIACVGLAVGGFGLGMAIEDKLD